MALTDAIAQAATDEERHTAIMRMTQQEQTATHLQSADSLEELLLKCAESKRLVDADQMWAYAMEGPELVSKAIDGDAVAEVRLPMTSTSIVGHVALTGQVVCIANAYDDAELAAVSPDLTFDKQSDVQAGYVTKSMLCAPIVHKGSVSGVVLAINKLTSDSFNFLDEETLNDLGRALGPVLVQLKQYEDQQSQLQYQEGLNALINRIHSARDLDQLLLGLKTDMLEILGAERLTIYAVDSETNELFSRVKEGDEIQEFRVPIDTSSVAGYTAVTRGMVNIQDAYDDAELSNVHHDLGFNRSFDAQTGFRTKEILAAAVTFEGDLLGVVQVLNSTDDGGFSAEDVAHIEEVSKTLGIAFANQARVGVKRSKFDDLVKRNLVKAEDLDLARATAREDGTTVEQVLLEEYRVPKNEMLEAFGKYFGCETFEFDSNMPIPQAVIATNKLDSQYDHLKYACWVPLEETEDGTVTVAVDDPKDIQKRDLIQAQLPRKQVDFVVGLPDDISAAVDLFYGVGDEVEGFDGLLDELEDIDTGLAKEETIAEASEDDSAIVKIVNRIIEDGYRRGASDIHVEPYLEQDTVIRYRVDGTMVKSMTLPRQYRNAILSRIKIMSELDIAERRNPQSGKIKFRRWGKLDIELRVETCPTSGGTEDCVMRILASSKPLPLDGIMSGSIYEKFVELVEQPYGIVLVVGPTGSGKTTTLHSALGHINKEDTKIWTAEDPVEITQAGLRQVQINTKAGLTFGSAMRSFLRADPDVIMVGEMRDEETTETGIEASLTGHLVFSTLHTNSAPETVTRLLEMGIDPYNFADAMLGVLAQRLVRTLCKNCKEEYHPEKEEYEALRSEYGSGDLFDEIGIQYTDDLKLCRAKEGGCSKCNGIGYKGRMGLYELLIGSDELKKLIYNRATAGDIREMAIQEGMRTLKQYGIETVLGGHTTIHEIRSVCTR